MKYQSSNTCSELKIKTASCVQDLYTNISVGAMLPIMIRPNIILKFEFVNIGISYLTVKKAKIDKCKLKAIQEHLLFWNYSQSFENFSILTTESSEEPFN